MRISTTQMFNAGVSAMQRAQTQLNHTSLQLATGRRILTPADDPSGATQSVRLQAAINATEQYQRNADFAKPRLEQEEGLVTAFDTALQRARELVVAGSNDTYNQEDRATIAAELRQIKDHILGLANSKDANGEYLFAGTDSFTKPFTQDDAGVVSYVAARGEGDVRDVAITDTRSIMVGDTGKSVFMDIPEMTGHLLEGVMGVLNTGTLVVEETGIADLETFDQTPEEVFTISFTDNAGIMEYAVTDSDGNPVLNEDGDPIEGIYEADVPIKFAGRTMTLSGTPGNGDTLSSRPAPEVSIFDTLDAMATAFERPITTDEGRGALSEAVEMALVNLDSSLGRANEVRTTLGLRLNVLDTQEGINDQRLVDLQSTLSDVRDLDFAEAISRFQLQEVVLQAAQQSYVQTSRLSLFDFL
ncbi:flagellar hook-associated protein FlgL [Thiocystis violacea]|uniref:flagellar hook-associated protein FlgL n=1 Tax=Thiocystis violacea TaxID=13725 RepID=UPI0019072E60|nr:flagellar hook-associated protein FlgL [Thiocystis violacea]MBK1723664.1 flagellar hook-associated protein 3 [Thiocystis violacea]